MPGVRNTGVFASATTREIGAGSIIRSGNGASFFFLLGTRSVYYVEYIVRAVWSDGSEVTKVPPQNILLINNINEIYTTTKVCIFFFFFFFFQHIEPPLLFPVN